MKKIELCLGTVQLGMRYGVTNITGEVSKEEAKKILTLAANSGITMLDTAQAYGNSEKVLGELWPGQTSRKIISKLKPNTKVDELEGNLRESMNKLKVNSLDTFLIHDSSDFKGEYGVELLEWLKGIRKRGLVERIGASIYDYKELQNIPLDEIQVVQLPLSIYDQRMILNGTLELLRRKGIAIHARSIFMQGIILQEERLPSFLTDRFREHHSKCVRSIKSKGLSMLSATLSFAKSQKTLETVIVGTTSAVELAQTINAWNNTVHIDSKEYKNWAWEKEYDVDPRFWKS